MVAAMVAAQRQGLMGKIMTGNAGMAEGSDSREGSDWDNSSNDREGRDSRSSNSGDHGKGSNGGRNNGSGKSSNGGDGGEGSDGSVLQEGPLVACGKYEKRA